MRRSLLVLAAAGLCACSSGTRYGPVADAALGGGADGVSSALAGRKAKRRDLRQAACFAAARGSVEVLQLLAAQPEALDWPGAMGYCLCAAGDDKNASMNQTPLMCAAARGQLEAARFLLAAGADPSRSTGMQGCRGRGNSPLMLAAREGHEAVVRLLLAAGADPRIETVDSRAWGCMKSGGRTAADWARESGHPEIAALIRQSPQASAGSPSRAGGVGGLGRAAGILGGFIPGLSSVRSLTDRAGNAGHLLRAGQAVAQAAQAGAAASAAPAGPAAEAAPALAPLAAQGHVPSQCALGRELLRSGGAAVEAYKWLTLCRRVDRSEETRKLAETAALSMSPEELSEGKRLAEAFQPELPR